MDSLPTPQFHIRRTTPDDALALKLIADRAFTGDTLPGLIYPPEKAHLTTPEEFHKWQVQRRRKILEKGNGDNFVVIDTAAHPGKIVGACRWDAPGRFADGKTLSSTIDDLTGRKEKPAGPLSEGEPGVIAAAAETADDPPACMDVKIFELIGAKMDEMRKKVMGGNADFWCDSHPTFTSCGEIEADEWCSDLAGLMIDPDYQRRGLARSLMQFGLDHADADGLPCYLESSRAARPVYPRFGFEKCGEIKIDTGDRVLVDYAMLRPAKQRQ